MLQNVNPFYHTRKTKRYITLLNSNKLDTAINYYLLGLLRSWYSLDKFSEII